MNKKISLVLLLLVSSITLTAQSLKERKVITQNYDQAKLAQLATEYHQEAIDQRNEAIEKAKQEGWEISGNEKGSHYDLIRLTPDGKPVYVHTQNYYVARTLRTNKLYNNGGLGLNVQGQNMIVGLWDGGAVRSTHNFLTGRVTQRDGAVFSSPTDENRHATHVTGTMIASGVARYQGMAFNASAWTHDWFNDESEMVQRASEGLLVSNHSYGTRVFNFLGQRLIDIYWFGKYDSEARNWDNIMYNAPYYLIVDAAGNDRAHQSQGPNKGGYDMLVGHSTDKNGITVAAVNRVSNYTGPNSVQMSSFSNWGPTDDGRIKPDISSQGVGVASCTSDSNTSTDTYDGTSMAAPGVTGSAILLQQHYNQTYGNYMRSATLKGLILHTADEAGSHPGPDYAYGWGLMNTAAAATAISDNGLRSVIKEITLNQGDTYSFTVNADGSVPLMASISWTDPAGQVITGTVQDMLDNPTPALVNDLDIRVNKNSNTYFPWKLNPANPSAGATQGDNIVDNFEKVQVNNPNGTYTITVSHKGNLKYGKQDVSIIVTGISNPFAINSANGDTKAVCSDVNTSVTYDLLYTKNSSTSGSTTFSVTGLPAGANATFTPSSLSANGSLSLEISGLNNVTAGKYFMEIVGTNGSATQGKNISLHVLKNTFTPVTLSNPVDGAVDMVRPFTLEWDENPNAQEYHLQVSYHANFDNMLIDKNINATSYLITEHTYGVTSGATYYWRVKPVNECAQGSFSNGRSFTTQQVNCNQDYNVNAINIPATANTNPFESTINFAQAANISQVKVYVDITHSRISDLEIKVQSPANTEVILNQFGTCSGNYQNIQVSYDDLSENYLECNSNAPAIRDDIKPFETLGSFNGQNAQGNWKLIVSDPTNGEGGSLNMWALEICEVVGINETQNFDLFRVWPNPSNGQINLELSAEKNIDVQLIDISGRVVFDREYNNSQETFTRNVMFGNLKKGIYLLHVTSGDKQGLKRIIIK